MAYDNTTERPKWTPERIETLQEMWAAGEAFSAIGKALGVSRNAAVGKAHRIGLGSRVMVSRPVRPVRTRPAVGVRKADKKPKPTPAPKPAPEPLGIPLVDLPATGCKWATGQRDGEHLFCGQPRDGLSPYCAEHRGRASGRKLSQITDATPYQSEPSREAWAWCVT